MGFHFWINPVTDIRMFNILFRQRPPHTQPTYRAQELTLQLQDGRDYNSLEIYSLEIVLF